MPDLDLVDAPNQVPPVAQQLPPFSPPALDPMQLREVVTMAGARNYLKCSRRAIYNWMEKGLITPYYTPGGGLRFFIGDLLRPTKPGKNGKQENA